jgi:hypothetical protein
MTALHTRAVITPPCGGAIEFAHEGLTEQNWRGYARQLYGWKAEVRVAGNEAAGEGTAWKPWWTPEMERVYGWRGKKRRGAREPKAENAVTGTSVRL